LMYLQLPLFSGYLVMIWLQCGGIVWHSRMRVASKSCCCTQILYFVNRVTNVWVNPIVTSFDRIVGNLQMIWIFLLLRIYLSTYVWSRLDKTTKQH
jgi:hypothetical protein